MKTVLIIEDNAIFAEHFERILRDEFKILHSNSSEEAIVVIDKFLPNAILLDVLLSGHSAFALLNELQSYTDTSKIPIVICTDLADELELSSLKSFNVVEIFDKSKVLPTEIKQKIREITNG